MALETVNRTNEVKLYGQTSTYIIDRNVIKGVRDDGTYGSYTCEVSSMGGDSAPDLDTQDTYEEDLKWNRQFAPHTRHLSVFSARSYRERKSL